MTLLRTKTFWFIALVLLAYGIIQVDGDGEPAKKPDGKGDDKVKMVLEIGMTDPALDSVQVAVAASLGSAGNYTNPSMTVWNSLRFPKKLTLHRFLVKRGEAVNADVVAISTPPVFMVCYFLQEGQGEDSVVPGYGDITRHHQNAVKGANPARCAAVAR